MKDKNSVKIRVWDTLGDFMNTGVAKQACQRAICAFVVFDLTSRDSFAVVPEYINLIKSSADPSCQIVVLGNKCDLCLTMQKSKEENIAPGNQ